MTELEEIIYDIFRSMEVPYEEMSTDPGEFIEKLNKSGYWITKSMPKKKQSKTTNWGGHEFPVK